ncbi:TapY2 family type IVa secretion system protein [Shewanella youngdeokensis]|uniref:TapY2 family type IVa secretion system protein n=1 Tax=Shewanella youngdeokensis TaxID=2999068 RepID=A0ABZ0JVR9_9GAMM|nr:TapY2 family type IVa secretion system protein [Shewanella sp. DAU334]
MKWILIASFAVFCVGKAQAADVVKKDFKCYVDTTIEKQVVFYRWDISQVERLIASLPATQSAKKAKNMTAYIKSVDECVLLDEPFQSRDAQRLDKLTLR